MGTGHSELDGGLAAGTAAATDALAPLNDAPAGLIIVYSSVRYDLSEVLSGVRSVTGDTPLVGASTSGHFVDGELIQPGQGVAVLALAAGHYQFGTAVVTDLGSDTATSGRELALAAQANVGPQPLPHAAMLIFAGGMTGDMEKLLAGIYRVTGAGVPTVGGAAGDDRRLEQTHVFHGDQVYNDAVVGVWISSPHPLRVVSGHGWRANGLPMLVTKTDGPVVHEIAGRPALDVYHEHFRPHPDITEAPDNATGGWYTAHSFGLIEPDGAQLIRGVFLGEDGLLHTFAPLPEYAAVQIVSANRDELLDVSETVATDALDGVADPAVMLLFSCVARMDLFDDRASEEAARLHKAAAPTTTFGFYTYGEFARTTSVAGYHNATLTALVL